LSRLESVKFKPLQQVALQSKNTQKKHRGENNENHSDVYDVHIMRKEATNPITDSIRLDFHVVN